MTALHHEIERACGEDRRGGHRQHGKNAGAETQ
jgi:hypothetical protein